MPAAVPETDSPSRTRILTIARAEFADRGFDGARLADIARQAGLSHPTLLYHFTSKAELYVAVIASAVVDWTRETEAAVSGALEGFDQVVSIIDAGFVFFATHPDFARILRREAMDGGDRLDDAITGSLRPFLDRAVTFLEREMAAG
ncbi:MAG: TetR/AcrR family transcriptional regulator, partial [Solirubrobacteraceae bacterium]|nr:TetR/AcrR family transcriptional regulator [Solirubrobacteraceae bacterium]